jgi:hypothetical protein
LQAQPDTTPRNWDDPKAAQKRDDARLKKAKQIRAEYRSWALQHKAMLAAMLASKGQDFSKLQSVYKVFPPVKMGDWMPDTKSGPSKFGWYINTNKLIENGLKMRPQDVALFASLKSRGEQKLKKEFAEKSDFTIAASDNTGPTTTYLWASGRITERTFIDNPDTRPGQRSAFESKHKELVPPFDFLT